MSEWLHAHLVAPVRVPVYLDRPFDEVAEAFLNYRDEVQVERPEKRSNDWGIGMASSLKLWSSSASSAASRRREQLEDHAAHHLISDTNGSG